MNDYLTEEDKKELRTMGYTEYNGEYGVADFGEGGTFRIIGRAAPHMDGNVPKWIIVTVLPECDAGSLYMEPDSWMKERNIKTLAPQLLKEIILIPYRLTSDSDGEISFTVPKRFIANAEAWIRENKMSYEVVLRKRE